MIASTRWCAASAGPATAAARASPRRTRSASDWRWSAPGATPGCRPRSCSLVEAHGTSTRVGDVVEVSSIADVVRVGRHRPRQHRPGFGEVEHRPPEGGGRGRGPAQGHAGAARQEDPAQPRLPRAQPEHRLGTIAVPRQHRAHRLEGACRAGALRGRERLRLRGHQLPRRARGVRARPPAAASDARARRRRRRPRHEAPSTAPTAKAPLRGALVLGAATEAELAEQLRAVLRRGRRPAGHRRPKPPTGSGAGRAGAHRHRLRRRRRTGRQG